MGCRSEYLEPPTDPDPKDNCSDSPNQKVELDKVTKLLCELCESVEENACGDPQCGTFSEELNQWWEQHKKFDRMRKDMEERREYEIRVKEKAFSKLTSQDMEVLGFGINCDLPTFEEARDKLTLEEQQVLRLRD